MSVDTIVRGGTIVTPERGVRREDLLIKDGKVVGLLLDSSGVDAAEVIDANGRHVLPGAIEPHVHIGIYTPSDGEWYSETCAAACGGVTTLINYFFHKDSYLQSWPPELAIAERQAVVDFACHFGILTEQHVAEMATYIREFEVTSFKFTGHWKGFEKQRIGSDTRIDDGLLYQTLRAAGKYPNVRVPVHAQNVEISIPPFAPPEADHFLKRDHLGRTGLDLWDKLNPGFTETVYAMMALYLAERTGASVYLVHTSAEETLQALRERYDLRRLNSYAETCAHYLALDTESPCGALAKVNPPVRDRQVQNALWQGVLGGTLSTVGTDHCAILKAMKKIETGDVLQARLGFSGMATMFPALVTHGVKKRGMSLERLVEISSTNAAKIFGLYPRKGTLTLGSDADFLVTDLDKKRVASASWIKGVSDFNVFEGEALFGFPERTVVRGRTVYHNDAVVANQGYGCYLPRRA
ncbi:MAG TPA: amidohydrolase family protein [bacterium]|nr:amidohydrolase family protein [bacterium]